MCGGFGCRQARFEHGASTGAVAFHCERRERVFDRDILRFGTATTISRFSYRGPTLLAVRIDGRVGIRRELALQGSPTRVQCLMGVIGA
jgi:hypothetical protein